jgi:hypothetical protein
VVAVMKGSFAWGMTRSIGVGIEIAAEAPQPLEDVASLGAGHSAGARGRALTVSVRQRRHPARPRPEG